MSIPIPLSQASICADCDFISDAKGNECPKCTSRSLLSLANVLNRSEQIISTLELEKLYQRD